MKVSISKKVVHKDFSSEGLTLFFNEIYWLKKLNRYKFVPKILNINYKKKIISLSYEGEKITNLNKPNNWKTKLKKILFLLKKNNCHHSDINPNNLLVKKNELKLIDFAQSMKTSDLEKSIFLKKRIFYDDFSINRINLSINENLICSNDLRVLVIWNLKHKDRIEKKLKQNSKLDIIDKIKAKKNFYNDIYKDRIFWLDQFYNRNINLSSEKLDRDIFIYIVKSINPIYKLNKMFFSSQRRVVDDNLFRFKKILRNNKAGVVHISDNFEEAKRNSILLSRSKNDYPAKYFLQTQHIYDDKKTFFKKLNRSKKLKYVLLRDQKSKFDDLDILVNDYFLFKRISDCHSYKLKNLNFISNAGDPYEDYGFKVANYVKTKNGILKIDVRFIGDGYFDTKWQRNIIKSRKFRFGIYHPNDDNKFYSILYHIIYHKGFIDKKYLNYLKKKLKTRNLNLELIKENLKKFLLMKKYKVTRTSDLTIPITQEIDSYLIKKEINLLSSQIESRNFSAVNKMIFNIIKFQKFVTFFRMDLIYLLLLNQFRLLKTILKRFLYKFISRN
jgi:hypothetical protein